MSSSYARVRDDHSMHNTAAAAIADITAPGQDENPLPMTRNRRSGVVGCAKSRAKILPHATTADAILRTR